MPLYSIHAWLLCAKSFPAPLREAACLLVEWQMELESIAQKVREPVLGQMRFAWWEEALMALETGGLAPKHPLIEQLQAALGANALHTSLLRAIWQETLDAFLESRAASNTLPQALKQLAGSARKPQRNIRITERWLNKHTQPLHYGGLAFRLLLPF